MKQSRIAVTGGIGSGKSEVMRILSEAGFNVIKADEISKSVNLLPVVVRKIEKAFGSGFVENGVVNSRKLAEFVFQDENRVKKLNRIAHPHIIREMNRQFKAAGGKVVFTEIPLLVEAKAQNRFDEVWLVTAPLEVRIERLKRRGMGEEQICLRMNNQLPDDIKSEFAHKIIMNDSSLEKLREQVSECLGGRFLQG